MADPKEQLNLDLLERGRSPSFGHKQLVGAPTAVALPLSTALHLPTPSSTLEKVRRDVPESPTRQSPSQHEEDLLRQYLRAGQQDRPNKAAVDLREQEPVKYDSQKSMDDLRREAKAREDELAAEGDRLANARNAAEARLQTAVGERERAEREFGERLEKEAAETETLRTERRKLEGECDRLKEEAEQRELAREEELGRMRQEVASHKDAACAAQDEQAKQRQESDSALRSAGQRIEALERKLKRKAGGMQRAREEAQEVRAQLEQQGQCVQLKEELATLGRQTDALRERYGTELRERSHEADELKMQLEAERTRRENQVLETEAAGERRIDDLMKENAELLRKSDDQREARTEKEERLQALERDLEERDAELRRAREKTAELEAEMRKGERRREELRSQMALSLSKYADLRRKLQRKKDAFGERLNRERSEATQRILEREGVVSELEQEVERMKRDMKETEQNAQAVKRGIEEDRREAAEVKWTLEERERELSALQDEVESLRHANAELCSQLEAVKGTTEKVRHELSEERARSAKKENKLHLLESRSEKAEAHLQDAEQRLQRELHEKEKGVELRLNAAMLDLESARQELRQERHQKEVAAEERDRLAHELRSATEGHKEEQGKMKTMTLSIMRENERLKATIKAHERDVEDLKRARDEALSYERKQIDLKEAQLERVHTELSTAKAELTERQNMIAKTEEERVQLRYELDESQRELLMTSEELKAVREHLTRMKSERAVRRKKLNSVNRLKDEIKELHGRLAECDVLVEESLKMKSRLHEREGQLRDAEERAREAETKLRDEEKRGRILKARTDQLRSVGKTQERELKQKEESLQEQQEVINRQATEIGLLKEAQKKRERKLRKRMATGHGTGHSARKEVKEASSSVEREAPVWSIVRSRPIGPGNATSPSPTLGGRIAKGLVVRGMHGLGWVMQLLTYAIIFLCMMAARFRSKLF